MGLLSAGTPLEWEETKRNVKLVQKRGIREFLKSFRRFAGERGYPFRWGDEIEFSIVRFERENKRAQLCLRGECLLDKLNGQSDAELVAANVTYHPEYASYMIESTPRRPFDDDLNGFKLIEDNMALRRRLAQQCLDQDEHIMAITNFPRIGCPNFTYPPHLPTPDKGLPSPSVVFFRTLFI